MINARTSVGLDVHARSVAACGLDGQTGEVFERHLAPDPATVIDWVQGLPRPVVVTCEAGQTGFGLARAFDDVGIRCLVAAPSKLQRPAGDRVKTDRRARCPAPGPAAAPVGDRRGRDPSRELEACRDLTRSREAARRELMSARHRRGSRCCATGSSTRTRRRGPRVMKSGCAGRGCRCCTRRWRSSPPMAPWSRRGSAGTGSTRRSRRWPRTAT